MQLHPNVSIILSTTRDGSLRSSVQPDPVIDDETTYRFLARHTTQAEQTVLLRLSYDSDDFCRYYEITDSDLGAGFTKPQETVADALVSRQPGATIFLAIADCVGTVLYHPRTRTLMLSHLGRHNLKQQGGTKSVEYLARYGVVPSELLVYLSPAADATHYPLYAFDNRSLHDVAVEQLIAAGVSRDNVRVDARDTVSNPEFFSHSAALRGEKSSGRHAVMCQILPRP